MVQVTFIDADGQAKKIEAIGSLSVMEAALMNGIDGIQSICGGICSCCACHCQIKSPWAERLSRPQEDEADALDGLPNASRDSRLACQVVITEQLDGLIVHLFPMT